MSADVIADADATEKPKARPRRVLDDYSTPQPLADAICARLAAILPTPGVVLEPSAGNGNFVRAARMAWPGVPILANDFRDCRPQLLDAQAAAIYQEDWVAFTKHWDGAVYPKPLLVVGNPPFSLVESHIAAGLDLLAPEDHLAFLLRLSILGGRRRSETLWSRPGFRYLIPIAGRPSFTDDGRSDSSEYMIAVWEGDHVGRAEVLQPLTWKAKTERQSG